MKKKNLVTKNVIDNRQSIVIIVCILLITTTSAATLSGVSIQTPSTSFLYSHSQTQFTESLQYSFSFKKPQVKKTALIDSPFSKVTLQGCTALGQNAGAPTLPVKFIKLLLPPKTTVSSIQVDGVPVEVEESEIDLLQNLVIPYQNPIPIGSKRSEEIAFDNDLYNSDEFYPLNRLGEQTLGFCRGYTVVAFGLHPVEYNPGKGELYYYPELIVRIDLEETTEDLHRFFRENSEDEEWVKRLVFNPEITERYHTLGVRGYPGGLCDPSDSYDYVIITTTYHSLDYWETSWYLPYNWESLMEKHTIEDGLSCTLVTIQDIDACTDYYDSDPLFNDTIAHIREFCRDAYEDWGTSYVLIGGDDEWIPARHMDYEHEENVDADIYWNHLDKTFNDDHDNLWGEEEDLGFDLYAEMYIGRIPCDEPLDVSNWLTKDFYYTDNVDVDYLENAAFFGGDMGWNCEGDDFIDYAAVKGTSDWLGPDPGAHGPYPTWLGFQYGFETWNAVNPEMVYNLSVKWSAEDPNPGWMGGNTSAAVTGFRNAVNNDHVTLISAIAHADPYMSMNVGCEAWEEEYHNTRPFFLADMGCHCGDMDDADDGVLHSMLFHSDTELAFACVFNTCFGWGSFDDTNSSSCLQMKLFWDYLFDTTNNSIDPTNWQLGKAMAWSKDVMAPTINWTYPSAPGTWRAIIQGCLLFGDPAQRIKPPITPEHNLGVSTIDVPSHVLPNDNIIVEGTIVNNGGNDEENIQVHFLVDDVELDNIIIPLLERQNSVGIPFEWTPTENGFHEVTINVTIPGIVEQYSHDNEKTKQVIVGPDVALLTLSAPEYAATNTMITIGGTIANLGLTDEWIDVSFIVNGTIEDTESVYLDSETSDNITFEWTPIEAGTYPIGISVAISGEEPFTENNQLYNLITVYIPKGLVLLVDDDDGDIYETFYINTLLTCEYQYDYWNIESQGTPTSDIMLIYDAVIWFTGEDFWDTITTEDQENLSLYLDNDGSLFATGQHIGYDIGETPFYTDYLHAEFLEDNTEIYTLIGTPDDPIGDNLLIKIVDGDGANNQGYPNGISPRTPATTVFEYEESEYDGGIKCVTYKHRVVYFSFGFEAISNMNDRTEVMSRILDWLLLELPVPNLSIDIKGGLGIKANIFNNGTIDIENMDVKIQVTGGILKLINKTVTETIDVSSGESAIVSTGMIIGIGALNIIVIADTIEVPAEGTQILFFSLVR